MTSKEWKELYLEIDEYYRDFMSKWRVADFRYPEQIKKNAAAVKEILSHTHELIFLKDELKELVLEDMDYGQRYWMEEVGMLIDTVYMRHIPILLHKIQAKIT